MLQLVIRSAPIHIQCSLVSRRSRSSQPCICTRLKALCNRRKVYLYFLIALIIWYLECSSSAPLTLLLCLPKFNGYFSIIFPYGNKAPRRMIFSCSYFFFYSPDTKLLEILSRFINNATHFNQVHAVSELLLEYLLSTAIENGEFDI